MMRRIHRQFNYKEHACIECIGYNNERKLCGERKSIFYGTSTDSLSFACKEIQFKSVRGVSKSRKRKKIESVYDYE